MARQSRKNQSHGPTGGLELSPGRKRSDARARKRQEKGWAKKSGDVTVRFVCPICCGQHHRDDCPAALRGKEPKSKKLQKAPKAWN